ncbi:hypothetical protein C9994_12045, partial [Marivirga lumbricoides]
MKKFRFSENILKISLIVAIFLLLGISGENYRQFNSYTETQEKINESYKTQANLQALLYVIEETEATHRSIIVTNERKLIEKYFEKKAKIQPQINILKKLTKDDPYSRNKIDSIQRIVNQRIDFLDNHLKIYDSADSNLIYKQNLASSANLLQEIERLIEEVVKQEDNTLHKTKDISDKKLKITPLLLLAVVLFSIFIFIISSIILYRYLQNARRNLSQSQINNMIYEQSERISRSGHWHFQPSTKKIEFSSNLYRLLGFEPNSFKPSLKKYLSVIDEADRSQLIANLKKLKSEGSIPSMDINITTPSGESRCLRFIARLVTDENGNDLIIGANKDLTFEIETNKELNELNSELKISNSIYKNAESIAMIGSYSYDFDKKKFAFSDNLFHILGYLPESFEASELKFIEFIHEDDRSVFIEHMGLHQAVNKHSMSRIRIIDKNGNLKYLTSNKKIFKENEKKIMIVTLKDISEEVMISKRLEEKNEDLIKSNSELESFNHIASHDLQEPLRKIQTFISRINVTDDVNLPPLIADYLSRIASAANRMQNLVIDLLSFSRASKENKVFENYDLNIILEDAIQELQTDIQEKDAQINAVNLPNSTVIPFQFQQLFVNLLSNSLKYAKEDVQPIITIQNESISQKDLSAFPNYKKNELVKISFEDNGIGFDQQYADNIFILFKRLHDRRRYSGTGIGLAICKKILQNHKGQIYAEGKPGIGSKFTI